MLLETLMRRVDDVIAATEGVEGATNRAGGEREGRTREPGRESYQPIAGLTLLRQEDPSPFDVSLYEPVVCLILRGRKEVTIGAETLSFGPGECLLVSHDMPVLSRVIDAPYLALVFAIQVATIRRLYEEVAESVPDLSRASAAQTQRADPALVDAFCRYVALAASPADAKVLAPLIAKEIHYRLLVAQFGGMLRTLTRHDSNASAIARAIGHIRADVHSPIAIPDLARRVGMSESAFHKHFKTITSTTPLQYQKELRLLEARRLIRTTGASVASAAFAVGYESASQFSREYSRAFGAAPSQAIPLRG